MPALITTEKIPDIRAVFDRAEYTHKGLVEALGPRTLPSRTGRFLPHFLHLTRRGRPLDTLIRLFLLGVPVEIEAAIRSFDPVP